MVVVDTIIVKTLTYGALRIFGGATKEEAKITSIAYGIGYGLSTADPIGAALSSLLPF